MTQPYKHLFSDEELQALVRRMELTSSLIRRQLEEQIIELVALPSDWLDKAVVDIRGDQMLDAFLAQKGWSESDLLTHVARPEALRRFAAAVWPRVGGLLSVVERRP